MIRFANGMIGMNSFGIGMNRMIPAGLGGKNKRDEFPSGMDDCLKARMNGMAGWKKTGFEDLRFRYTWDIVEAAGKGLLPDKVMLNVHPHRWTDRPLPWVKEFVGQSVKNVIKRAMLACWDSGMLGFWNAGIKINNRMLG